MKKIIASLSTVALLAMSVGSSIVSATGVNSFTSVVASGNVTNSTITFTKVATFGGVTSATATIKNLDGTAAGATTLTYNTATADTLVFNVATANLTDNAAYVVSFLTNDNLYASAKVNVGTPTNDVVTVTATVLPTLTMALSESSLNFGTLVPGTENTQSLNVLTSTNAKDGITVSMGSTGLATGGAGTDKYIGGLLRGAAAATTPTDDYYKVSSVAPNAGTVLTDADITANNNILVATTVAKANDTTAVTVKAMARAQTEAGNYNDVLTFTVAANF
ncbi:MAG: hypothetical protein PHO80_01855 [Candidatus Gracilibacteria bacterium]|nr:hypothetical protein [Candidatus Gracilibacteria bacterium]